jgi:tetratricopeptide (TPR) repeat protein
MLSRVGDAKSCFEKVLRVSPRDLEALGGMAQVAALEGRFDEAEAAYMRVLEIEPKAHASVAALAHLRKLTPADRPWLERAQDVAASGLAPLNEADVHYAIGKYYDDVADFARAFASYRRANELVKAVAERYDRDGHRRYVDDLTRVWGRERLTAAVTHEGSQRPVFVVGMPRSGTSLVEQIIASHPRAKGAGELGFWPSAVRKYEKVIRKRQLDASVTARLATSYLRVLEGHSADALRVVDKLPLNADHMGIIHTVFPNARIIYLRRDPIDTCLSCYFQRLSPTLSFTMDLSDLAHYYRQHHRLIEHWRAILPPRVLLEVPYAELIAEPAKWIRRIVDFLGLDWDERCLEFHRTARPVVTASYWQVRQKIYNTSVGRWRHYAKFIGPLLELKDLA